MHAKLEDRRLLLGALGLLPYTEPNKQLKKASQSTRERRTKPCDNEHERDFGMALLQPNYAIIIRRLA